MASEIPKQVIHIRDQPTKSVTLYPARAHVVREINNIVLKPGANEVQIYGLTPTVDENSIQIEGRGAAPIVDLTTELVANHDIFEDVYPDDDNESSDESDREIGDSNDEDEKVKGLTKELKTLRQENEEAIAMQGITDQQRSVLDRYTETVHAKENSAEDVSKLLRKYAEDRASINEVHAVATRKSEALVKEIAKKEIELWNAQKTGGKEKRKRQKLKEKEKRKVALQKAQKQKEAHELEEERVKYWPKRVYRVMLQLEATSVEMPASSRRGSLDSVTLAQSPQTEQVKEEQRSESESTSDTTISLSLSYVTREAGWSPRYDLRISSTAKSAIIVYRTEFFNHTGETWKDARLAFSTSQTSYQGLDDTVPYMHAWHVKLARHENGNGGLLSKEESTHVRKGKSTEDKFDQIEFFGLEDDFATLMEVQSLPRKRAMPHPAGTEEMNEQVVSHVDNAMAHVQLDRSVNSARRARRAPAASIVPALARSAGSVFSSSGRSRSSAQQSLEHPTRSFGPYEHVDFDESEWEDNGLTTTYDVPGVRTLVPSSKTRRHKIASLNAANITLSHICVPKLRAAAFLKSKIRNPSSSVTLLKGTAGVALDGSFLGNMIIPRVSPNQTFELSLGVDPAIHINYPKPGVHRATQGMIFNKELAQTFTRSIWINNTKAVPVDLLVFDQVPISEDERLRIVITGPKGLAKEGDKAKAGEAAKEGGAQGKPWGSAVAMLKKDGELRWQVELGKSQGCLLKLDYEARFPPQEKIVAA